MKMKNIWYLLFLGLFLVGVVISSGCIDNHSGMEEKEFNILHETIITPEFSYELYLPENYSTESTYPLLLCLSPGGNGESFYSSICSACNRFNCVVVCSNDFKNNIPVDDYLPKINGTIGDVMMRVNLDEERIYLGGFSGGGMGSYVVSYFKPNFFRGLIINSGAIHSHLYDEELIREMGIEKVALICGTEDNVVSCSHMKNDEEWLKKSGIRTLFIEFEGGHQIAPADTYITAIEWLEDN